MAIEKFMLFISLKYMAMTKLNWAIGSHNSRLSIQVAASENKKITHVSDLVQDCSNSIANALELVQSCTKPWTCQCQYYPLKCCIFIVLTCFFITFSFDTDPGIRLNGIFAWLSVHICIYSVCEIVFVEVIDHRSRVKMIHHRQTV